MVDRIDMNANPAFEAYEHGSPVIVDSKGIRKGLSEAQFKYMDSIQPCLNDLKDQYEKAKSDLQELIDNCDDPIRKQKLEGQMDRLERTWKQITHHPPGQGNSLTVFKGGWEKRIDNMRDAIIDTHYTVQGKPSTEPMVAQGPRVASPVQQVRVDSSGGASADASSSAGGATAAKGSGGGVDVKALINLMSTDPQAALEKLNSLDPEQRTQTMAVINQQLQEINQMVSMMSNMQKSIHDTSKSAINNMRV